MGGWRAGVDRAGRPTRGVFGHELGPALGPGRKEAHDALSEVNARAVALEQEDLGQRDGLLLRVVRAQVQLPDLELLRLRERVVHPVTRRVHLQPVTGLRGHERSLPGMVLNLEPEIARAVEHGLVVLLVECDAEVVDAWHVPVARLEDDVDRPAPDLDEAKAKADPVELFPGRAGFEPVRALAAPAVAADELEAELAEIAGLEQPDLARHEVVVEQVHRPPHRIRAARRT